MGRIGAVLLFALIPLSAAVLVAGYVIEARAPLVVAASDPPRRTPTPEDTPLPTPTHAPAPTPHPAARDGGAWATSEGRVFGAGGRGPSGVALDSVTTFDGAVWTDLPPLPEPRVRGALVAMPDGRLLHLGGDGGDGPTDTTFILEPGSDAWSAGPPMPTARTSAIAVASGERAFVLGGLEPAGEDDLLVYDAAAAAWSTAAPPPDAATDAMAAVFDGRLYVFGGEDATGEPSAATFRYEPATDTWTALAPMPAPASGAPTAVVDDRIWILAPRFADARTVDTLPVFEPSTETWLTAEGQTGFSPAGVDVALPLGGGRILLIGAGGSGFSVTVLSTSAMELRQP